MIVKILSLDTETEIARIVVFGSEQKARWRGHFWPEPEQLLHAELECEPLLWHDVTVLSDAPYAKASAAPSEGVIRAEVLGVDNDKAMWLQIQEAALLVETIGEPPVGIVGALIEFVPVELEVYPSDL